MSVATMEAPYVFDAHGSTASPNDSRDVPRREIGAVKNFSYAAAVSILLLTGGATSYTVVAPGTNPSPRLTNAAAAGATRIIASPSVSIESIRANLKLTVTEVAGLLGVSRQAVYKWLSGSVPDPDKLLRLETLSQIGLEFAAAGVVKPQAALDMRLFDGKSLSDLIREDEVQPQHIAAAALEAVARQTSYSSSGLSQSTTAPRDAWTTSESLASAGE